MEKGNKIIRKILTIITLIAIVVISISVISHAASYSIAVIIYAIIGGMFFMIVLGIFCFAIYMVNKWLDFEKIISIKNIVIIFLLLALPVFLFIEKTMEGSIVTGAYAGFTMIFIEACFIFIANICDEVIG